MKKYLVFETKEQADQTIPVNQIKKIRIDQFEFCMARTVRGFSAFAQECPHLGDDLSRGTLNSLGEVVCPWHSYRFDLINGEECENRCKTLKIFHTDWENGQLFVFL